MITDPSLLHDQNDFVSAIADRIEYRGKELNKAAAQQFLDAASDFLNPSNDAHDAINEMAENLHALPVNKCRIQLRWHSYASETNHAYQLVIHHQQANQSTGIILRNI